MGWLEKSQIWASWEAGFGDFSSKGPMEKKRPEPLEMAKPIRKLDRMGEAFPNP
jgi:hypothetical protein